MSKRIGQVVLSTLVTPDDQIKFPVVDGNDIGGGRHIVSTLADRNAIPAEHRKAGMIVYVSATGYDYILKSDAPTTGDTTNGDWDVYSNAAVEHIGYADSVSSGFATLQEKLGAVDGAIAEAAEFQNVESTEWGTTPEGANRNKALSSELNTLFTTIADQNDPTKIVVGQDAEQNEVSLSDKLAAVDASIAGINTTLEDQNDPTKIIVDYLTTATPTEVNLSSKLTTIDEALAGINTTLIDQNDPNKIIVGKDAEENDVSLTDKVAAVDSSLNTLNTTIADQNDPTKIVVGKDAEENDVSLADKVAAVDSSIAGINTTLEDQNDPTKIIVGQDAEQNEVNLSSKLSSLDEAIAGINTTLADQNDPTKIVVGKDAEENDVSLADKLTAVDTTLADQNDADKIMVQTSGGNGLNMSLNDRLGLMDTTLADQNDPTKIVVGKDAEENDVSLADKLTAVDSSIAGINTTLEDQNDPTKIVVGKDAEQNDVSLADKLTAVDSSIAGINTTLEDQNDPTKIVVGKDAEENDVSLADKLTAVDTTLADQNDADKIMVQTSGGNGLNMSLNDRLGLIDTTLADQNDPTKIVVEQDAEENDVNLVAKLAAVSAQISSLEESFTNAVEDVVPEIKSFELVTSAFEAGQTVTTLTVKYAVNKVMQSLAISMEGTTIYSSTASTENSIPTTGEIVINDLSITSDKVLTLEVSDGVTGHNTVTATTDVTFVNKFLFGAVTEGSPMNQAVLDTLGRSDVGAVPYNKYIKIDCGNSADKVPVLAVPATLGVDAYQITFITGYNNNWTKQTVNYTNASGAEVAYDVFVFGAVVSDIVIVSVVETIN